MRAPTVRDNTKIPPLKIETLLIFQTKKLKGHGGSGEFKGHFMSCIKPCNNKQGWACHFRRNSYFDKNFLVPRIWFITGPDNRLYLKQTWE